MIRIKIVTKKNSFYENVDLLKAFPNSGFENFKAFKDGRFYVSKPDLCMETKDPVGYMRDYAKMIHPELFPDRIII